MRIEQTDDDELLALFNRRHWQAMGVAEDAISGDWLERSLSFITESRSKAGFAGFLAVVEEEPVGSACCQLAQDRYPDVLGPQLTKSGYLWGVFVEPEYRGGGVGQALVEACIKHLGDLGCNRVDLHAGDRSRPLYERMGFRPTDEMSVRLR